MDLNSPGIHDQTMCSRRGNSSLLQALFLVTLFGSLVYCFLLYNSTALQLAETKSQYERSARQRESLAAQLQVVYEHRAKLEKSLQREKNDHKDTKREQLEERQEFLVNVTRTKHEHMNRFNSLDTSHKMLKAQYDQLQTEYMRMQQQHARVTSEHTTLYQRLSQSLEALKVQKKNEINGLEAQVTTLQEQTEVLRSRARSYYASSNQYKALYEKLTKENGEYKKKLASLREEGKQKPLSKEKELPQKETKGHQDDNANTQQTQNERKSEKTYEESQRRDERASKSEVQKSAESKDSSRTSRNQQSDSASQARSSHQAAQRKLVQQPILSNLRRGSESESQSRNDAHGEQSRRSQSSRLQMQQDPKENTRALGQSDADVQLKDHGHQPVQVVKPSAQTPDQQEDNPAAAAQNQEDEQNQDTEGERGEGHERQERDLSQERELRKPEDNRRYLREPDIYEDDRKLRKEPNEPEEENFEDALDDGKLSQPMGVDRPLSRDDEDSRHEDGDTLNSDEDQSQQRRQAEPIKSQLDRTLTNPRKVQEVVDDITDHVADGVPMVARPIQGVPKKSQRQERTLEKILL